MKNFDFDDLYKMGKEKVVKITSSGKNKIKSGISYAGSVIKKYIKKDDEYNINENADFNSYDLSPKKDFSSPQNQGYNPKIGEEIDGKNTE